MINSDTSNMLMEPLLSDRRSLYREIPNKRIQHVYREANQCADALARLRSTVVFSLVVFVEPSSVGVSLLAFDEADSFCNRLISS